MSLWNEVMRGTAREVQDTVDEVRVSAIRASCPGATDEISCMAGETKFCIGCGKRVKVVIR